MSAARPGARARSVGGVRPASRMAALLVLLWGVCSCGLPGSGTARSVEDDEVPYDLLASSGAPAPPTVDEGTPARAPTVFWVNGSRLAPEATTMPCAEDDEVLVQDLLTALLAGPAEEARADGRSSAVPTEFSLDLVGIEGDTAMIDIEPDASVSAERLPFAVGQIVLTVTSAPSVRSVVLVSDGEPVQVPLPDGALTAEAATAEDYAELLPERLQDSGPPGCPSDPDRG